MKKIKAEAPPSSSAQTPEAGSPGSPFEELRGDLRIALLQRDAARAELEAERRAGPTRHEWAKAVAEIERLNTVLGVERHNHQQALDACDALIAERDEMRAALEEIATHYEGAGTKRDLARGALENFGGLSITNKSNHPVKVYNSDGVLLGEVPGDEGAE